MVSEKKKQLVQELVQRINDSPVVGIVNLQSLPAPQFQVMRNRFKSQNISFVMARKKLLQRALSESRKENLSQLAEKIKGMPALVFSRNNPFALYAVIQKNKSEAPAKAGQTAPRDIVVRAGPTSFTPGPIISELASAGIKTKVEQGKLSILQDTTIAREGEIISSKLADTLKKLDIRPMEIGLDLVAVWEDGLVFNAQQLHIDEAEFAQKIASAVQWGINLAMEIAYPTVETKELLLQKAFSEAKALSLETNILTDLTAGEILAKIERQALALKEAGGLEIPEKALKKAIPVPVDVERKEESSRDEKKEKMVEKEEAVDEKENPGNEAEKRPAAKEELPKSSESSQKIHRKEAEKTDTEKFHPKQGRVTQEEATNLLAELQKKGTLR